MARITTTRQEKAAAVLLLLSNLLLFLTLWLKQEYNQVRIDEVLYQIKTTSTGVHGALLGSAVLRIGVFSALLMLAELGGYRAFFQGSGGPAAFMKRHAVRLTAALLILSIVLFGSSVDAFRFVTTAAAESDFIETHYTDPSRVTLRFPQQKRNLIYIFLESMENTYADPKAGEPITDCFIPELEALAGENVNFSHTDGLGGALPYAGTTWTAAAMMAQTAGIPMKVALTANTYGQGDSFLPGATSIGEILAAQGYEQVLLLGSNAEFHGREQYFTEHGNYTILDTDTLKAAGRLEEDYDVWWGMEDMKLFAFAQEELTRLAATGKPFNLTMLTADTHFPDGYRCPLCGEDYPSQYANVLACSAKQVAAFVAWIQAQPFYADTTVVISGDHLTMDGAFMEDIDPAYTRTVYNCILNPAVAPQREKNRQFGTFDMFPTTLAALGVKIEGERLALGTNLFSGRETLTEEYGYAFLEEELQKHSDFYNETVLELEEE